jgi:hypothetical protein
VGLEIIKFQSWWDLNWDSPLKKPWNILLSSSSSPSARSTQKIQRGYSQKRNSCGNWVTKLWLIRPVTPQNIIHFKNKYSNTWKIHFWSHSFSGSSVLGGYRVGRWQTTINSKISQTEPWKNQDYQLLGETGSDKLMEDNCKYNLLSFVIVSLFYGLAKLSEN